MLHPLNSKRFRKILCGGLFTLVPLLSAILFCFRDGKLISDFYIPLGGWSDEITYYKQIEGILAYCMPRGYFGYNQSRALYGSLGVWGLLPLILMLYSDFSSAGITVPRFMPIFSSACWLFS